MRVQVRLAPVDVDCELQARVDDTDDTHRKGRFRIAAIKGNMQRLRGQPLVSLQ